MERPGLSDFTPSGLHSNLSPKNLLEEAASESFAIVSGFLSGIELQILLATDDAVNHPRPVQAVEYQGLRVPVVLRGRTLLRVWLDDYLHVLLQSLV